MNFWNRIKSSITGKYLGTSQNEEAIKNRVASSKEVNITNPTSKRTFHRNGSFLDQQIDIGDTTTQNINAKTGETVSSAISKVRYNPKTNRAFVTFQGGNKEYEYKVTPDEFQDFVEAPSKGQHVGSIWNHNPHFRVPGY